MGMKNLVLAALVVFSFCSICQASDGDAKMSDVDAWVGAILIIIALVLWFVNFGIMVAFLFGCWLLSQLVWKPEYVECVALVVISLICLPLIGKVGK